MLDFAVALVEPQLPKRIGSGDERDVDVVDGAGVVLQLPKFPVRVGLEDQRQCRTGRDEKDRDGDDCHDPGLDAH